MMGSVSPMGGGSAGQSIIGVWPDCANGVSLHGVAYTWPYPLMYMYAGTE